MSEIEASGRVKLISGIPEFIAKNGLKLIESRIDKLIPDETPLQKGSDIFFEASSDLLNVITDENADNKGQV